MPLISSLPPEAGLETLLQARIATGAALGRNATLVVLLAAPGRACIRLGRRRERHQHRTGAEDGREHHRYVLAKGQNETSLTKAWGADDR